MLHPKNNPSTLTLPIKERVVVAIPAYNEEAHIEKVIRLCLVQDVTVWIINDGSSDRTVDIAQKAGAHVIHHERNIGKGMAIRTALNAFKQSKHKFLILMDADGQHDPALITSFIERAEGIDAGLILGNRMLSITAMPFVRLLTNRFMSWLISLLVGQKIPDTQCGYRLISRTFAEKFHPTTYRFDLESEMLIQATRLGIKIESVPVPTIYTDQSSHIHPLADTLRFTKLILRYLRK